MNTTTYEEISMTKRGAGKKWLLVHTRKNAEQLIAFIQSISTNIFPGKRQTGWQKSTNIVYKIERVIEKLCFKKLIP